MRSRELGTCTVEVSTRYDGGPQGSLYTETPVGTGDIVDGVKKRGDDQEGP